MTVYIDGRFYEKEEAKISVYDHGVLYGDGVFEGIRIYNSRIFRLQDHLVRLYDSAHAIMLTVPLSMEDMEQAVLETVALNRKKNGYIRLLVTRGVGDLGINPLSCRRASVIIIVDDIQLYPRENYEQGIKIITASSRRISSDSLDPRIKSLNYLNNILAKIEAQQAGCLEAVMLNRQGFIAECTGDNIFIIKQSVVKTPSAFFGSLGGITRDTVLGLAGQRGLACMETGLTQYDLYTADECFLTGTGAEIIPVVSVDGRMIGTGNPGELTKVLMRDFTEKASSEFI